ncbi:S1 RNA-binding domain-containing protein [Aerococcaceae bacterium zg-ZJ1578]|uniref:CvfD/Ygs/GSP13 family RNA-binding post-transcriptional regulator n=1 Tax=Aerococcaceae bacterium zg-252 TaxID=2796928 RepID=UPI001A2B56C1|nr:S1 RNA-binding domain-containing protein [Aerococcaceae bacterium zg-1578]MBR7928355.1 S1 RNA-binding domain-containing protein [Aerococcaceae bacterium zg-ZUI334]MBS4461486.1 S1 RNA-binding domain-containing protein [Aerococcaceae bacterium zg-B36]
MSEFKIGDIIEGEVTGVQNYGVFVGLSKDVQGLIHISECRHGYVTDFDHQFKIGQKVKVIIVDIDEYTGKISLSMRALNKLNTPPFPARPKKRRKRYTPSIGFATMEKKLPHWINEAIENIEIDRYNQNKKKEG